MQSNKAAFWRGIKYEYNLCCIMFFMDAWWNIRHSILEYSEAMSKLTNNNGEILCPDCLIKRIKKK